MELTEAEIDSLTLAETKKLAEEIVNTFKTVYSTLTVEEINVANIPSYDSIVDIYNTITNENHTNYIGDNKYELKAIILEYIDYQIVMRQSDNNIFEGITIGYQRKILSNDIVDTYPTNNLNGLSTEKLKELALETIKAYIEAYEHGVIVENEIPIMNFHSKQVMEDKYEELEILDATIYNNNTRTKFINAITEYRGYQDLLLKDAKDYTEQELYKFKLETLKQLAKEIVNVCIENYGILSSAGKYNLPSQENMETLRDTTIDTYTTQQQAISVITNYLNHGNGINKIYTQNYTATTYTSNSSVTYMNYSDYVKEALMETSNYIDSKDTSQDKKDVVNIIKRFKSVNIDNTIALPKIKVINLSTNNLTDISKLTNITTLVELYASDNIIRDLSLTDFTEFEKLNTLDLSHNRIYETKIGLMPNLANLNLSYNYIEKIDGMQLSAFTKLQSINLAGNRIYDLQPIMYNLYQIAKVQDKNKVLPIVTWTNTDGIFASWTDIKEFGYVANKAKVNFADQTIYASVADKLVQGIEEYVKLPAIFNQVKYIDCGETNFLNAKATNDGMIMYLDTSRLGEQTEVAYIQGTGVATGTKCYVNYTVATEEEVKIIPVTSILVQEEIVLDDENSKKPDLNKDGKVSTEDLNLLKNGIAKVITLTDDQKAVSDIVPDKVLDMNDVLVLEKIIKASWPNTKLTLEQREKASQADVDSNGTVEDEDLRLLAMHNIDHTSVTGNFNQDINSDGKTDIEDIILLSKYIASKSTERRNTDSITLSILNKYVETRQLIANILPEDATDKTVTWVSNNENIVKVDANGKVTAVGEGTTTINVASKSNANIFKTIRVDVVKAANIVEDINIVANEKTGNLNIKQAYYVGEALDLAGAKLEVVRRDGSKEIIDITPEMLEGFTTETVGEKIVTVTYEDVTTTYEVNVTEYNEPKVDITVDNLDAKLPENVTYDGQEHLAEVALKEGVKAGSLTVTYKDASGNDVEKPVNAGEYTVIANITDSIYANPAEIEVGTFTIAKAELPAEVRPNIATEYTIEKDGNLNVAAENGIITMPEGTAFDTVGTKDVTLTFIPNDTNYASIEIPVKVNVVISVTGVNLNKREHTMFKGDTVNLDETVIPANATNPNVTWSSSDEDIAKVDDAGNVTAVGIGTVNITATTKDGGKTATCRIVVEELKYQVGQTTDEEFYISGISPNTTEAEVISNLKLSDNYKVVKADGVTALTDGEKIATGYKLVELDEEGQIKEVKAILVVKGDINGDGDVDGTDSIAIIYHVNNKQKVTDEIKLKAADANSDGTVDMTDYTRIIYHYIGISKL